MASTLKLLSARQVDTLPTGFHSDGGNLYLRVKDTGARSWVFRFKAGGKVRELGLGSTNAVALAAARGLAAKMRTSVQNGADPAECLNRRDTTAMTFKDYALEYIENKSSGWRNEKHIAQWQSTLEQYAFPSIGGKLPADVSLADVKAILLPMWAIKTETATRLRQRI